MLQQSSAKLGCDASKIPAASLTTFAFVAGVPDDADPADFVRFSLRILDEVLSVSVPFDVSLRKPRRGEEVRLPFGLTFGPSDGLPVVPPAEDCADTSSDDVQEDGRSTVAGSASEETEASEGEDADVAPHSPALAPPAPVVESRKLQGILGWNNAPTRQSKCFFCRNFIDQGQFRWIFRPAAQQNFNSFIHEECAYTDLFPGNALDTSIATLKANLASLSDVACGFGEANSLLIHLEMRVSEEASVPDVGNGFGGASSSC